MLVPTRLEAEMPEAEVVARERVLDDGIQDRGADRGRAVVAAQTDLLRLRAVVVRPGAEELVIRGEEEGAL